MTTPDIQIKDCFKSIKKPSTGLYKDKGSKFLAFAYPVESEEQVKEIVAGIKKEYFDARHHCYAYRLGHTGEKWRMNDDGEPSSTAGKPILGQILSNDLSDILIVVVRYFGGILLGTSGLIAAYKSAAAEAIAAAETVEKIACEPYNLSFGYLQMNEVMKALKDMHLTPTNQNFGNSCSLDVQVRLSMVEQFKNILKNITVCPKI